MSATDRGGPGAGGPYLGHDGLPRPAAQNDGLDAPYWEAAREHRLVVQQCASCHRYQWGPEWICHRCLSFDLGWADVEAVGTVYSWERPWHPVHPALRASVPYIIVLVELARLDGVRMVGNLLGDPAQSVRIGEPCHAVFEDHEDYTLVQWALD